MTDLESIGIKVENGLPAELPTGNDLPILHEIAHALEHLIETGEETIIDLRGIPLAPGEEKRIEAALGGGEVECRLNALGASEIVETAFPGIWWVVHYNAEDEVMGKFIEVTRVPSISSCRQARRCGGGFRCAS